jgi:hypothetical protein
VGTEPAEVTSHRNDEGGASIARVRYKLDYWGGDLQHWRARLTALEAEPADENQAGPATEANLESSDEAIADRAPVGLAAKRKSAQQLASELKAGKRYRSDVTGDGPEPNTTADDEHDRVNHLGPPEPADDSDEGDPGPLRQLVEAELLVQTRQAEFDDAQLMIHAQGATLTQHVVSAGHEAAGLETAEKQLNAAEENANKSFNNALQEAENGTKMLREQAAAFRVLMNATETLESQYIRTEQGQAIWHGLYVRFGIINAHALSERGANMPSPNPARANLPYHDQYYERVNELLGDVNDIIGHLKDLYDANEVHRMVPSYASKSAQLRAISCAAASMRDAIDQLADCRLTMGRAHRAHMLHGAQGLHRLREQAAGANEEAAAEFSRVADPWALRVLVGPSSHGGGWALATMDIRGTHYNLGDAVGLAPPRHGFERANNGRQTLGTTDVHGAYYYGVIPSPARYFGEN